MSPKINVCTAKRDKAVATQIENGSLAYSKAWNKKGSLLPHVAATLSHESFIFGKGEQEGLLLLLLSLRRQGQSPTRPTTRQVWEQRNNTVRAPLPGGFAAENVEEKMGAGGNNTNYVKAAATLASPLSRKVHTISCLGDHKVGSRPKASLIADKTFPDRRSFRPFNVRNIRPIPIFLNC